MVGRKIRARKWQQYLSWGVLAFVVVYFLSPCTLNPLVHADLIRTRQKIPHESGGHCSRPAAQQAPPPLSADHEGTNIPVCCELIRTHKITRVSSGEMIPLPLLAPALLPPDAGTVVGRMEGIHTTSPLHSSLSPPLYLLHATLLI